MWAIVASFPGCELLKAAEGRGSDSPRQRQSPVIMGAGSGRGDAGEGTFNSW